MGNSCNCDRGGAIEAPDINLSSEIANPLKKTLIPLTQNYEIPSFYSDILETLPLMKNHKADSQFIEDRFFYQLDRTRIYQGTWTSEGMASGFGTLLYLEKGLYQGNLVNAEPKGQGRFISKNKEIYTGEFAGLNKLTGKMLDNEGTEVTGIFVDLYIEGEGTETWKNGTIYSGVYCKGVKCGKGKMTWLDGKNEPNEIYEGEFSNNMFNGYGVYDWSKKRKYSGEWKDGKMHGNGTFEWKDGRVYIGSFKEDLKEGFGEFKWNDGRIWKGDWMKGLKNGIGLNVESGGKEMVGEWKEDKRIRWLEGDEAKEALRKLKNVDLKK